MNHEVYTFLHTPFSSFFCSLVHLHHRTTSCACVHLCAVGYEPGKQPYIGGECGQGFLYSLFYSNGNRNCSAGIEEAWQHGGLPRPRAVQIDRCRWNYQAENTEKHCYDDFTCGEVRAIHKMVRPDRDGQMGRGCFYYADGVSRA